MEVHRNPHTFHKDLDIGGNIILDEQGLQDRIATSYYRMDGNGDYAALADDAKQDVGINDFGLSVRFKPDNVATARQVLQNKESGGIGHGLEIREDDLWIRLDDGTVDVTAKIATAVFSNDVWFHALSRFDRDGNATAYINGVKVGTVDISTASLTLSNAGAYRVGTESGGTTLEFTGQISHNRIFNYLISETDAKSYSQGGAVDYSDIGPANTELMPNQVDRDFSGASAWTNVDINAYDETGDLTITATAADQYAEIAVASAPMTQGKRYRWYYDAANIISTWVIKDFTGVQTFGTISANATQGFIEFIVDSGITGGFRIVSGSTTSSIDFDNFSLFQAGVVSDYRPVSITAGTWYDLSGNDLDLTITNAIAVGVSETIITAEEIVFAGGTGDNKISIPDNLADALSVQEAANKYLTFVTTDASESVDILKNLRVTGVDITLDGDLDFVGAQEISTSGNAVLTLNPGTADLVVSNTGILFINETANTNMTTGITIQQGAADNDSFAIKSSDVSTPITDIVGVGEGDTYFSIKKWSAADGGVVLSGFSDATLGTAIGLFGYSGDATPTSGNITFRSYKSDGGTGTVALADGEIIIDFENATTTKLQILGDGTLEFQQASSITTGGNNALTLNPGTADVVISNQGILFINETVNTNMTTGITIHQGTADDEAFALKSSDISHAVTTQAEADTYGMMKKRSGSAGGLFIMGITDISSSNAGLWLRGVQGVSNPDDTHQAITLQGAKKDGGSNIADLAAAETVLDIRNSATKLISILGDGTFQFEQASSITTGGAALLTLTGTTAGVRLDDGIGIDSVPAPTAAGIVMSRSVSSGAALYSGISYTETVTVATTQDYNGLLIDPANVLVHDVGTHAAIYGIKIGNFTVTEDTTSTIISLVGLYIEDVPQYTGAAGDITNLFSILVDAGACRFDDVIYLGEITTPTAIDTFGAVYPKADNELYFQSGDGVEHVILKGAAATRDLFFQPIEAPTGVVGDWEVHEINASQEVHFIFHLPSNFTTLVSANIVMIPDATETIQWDANISVAANGEASAADTRSVADDQLAVTSGNLTEVDISDELTGLAAEDYVAVNFQADTANLRVIGIEIEYE